MHVYTTSALEDPRDVRDLYPRLEEIGYDGVFSFEAKHDPFVALAVAAEHTTRARPASGSTRQSGGLAGVVRGSSREARLAGFPGHCSAPTPEKACTRCNQWVGPAERSSCGSCKLLKGPIHPNGTCKAFAAKGG